jgi:hypothetical protein
MPPQEKYRAVCTGIRRVFLSCLSVCPSVVSKYACRFVCLLSLSVCFFFEIAATKITTQKASTPLRWEKNAHNNNNGTTETASSITFFSPRSSYPSSIQ